MADISSMAIKPVGVTPTHVTPEAATRQTAKPKVEAESNRVKNEAAESKQNNAAKEAEETKTKEFGPVIAASEDGDTVRVKSQDESENFKKSVYNPSPTYEEMPKAELDDISFSNWTPKASNLSGFTEDQLRNMYKNGEISEIKYREELDSRAEAKETSAVQNEQISSEISEEAVELKESENTDKALEELEQSENEAIPVEVRAEMLQNIQNQTM